MVTVFLQIGNFLHIGFFGKSNDRNGISNVKKKLFKKIKYWRRNGGFTSWSEVKITRSIDSLSAVLSNQFLKLEVDFLKK